MTMGLETTKISGQKRKGIWRSIPVGSLNKILISCVLQVMVGDEIQWLLGVLKIFMETG